MPKDGNTNKNADGLSHLDKPSRARRKAAAPARFLNQPEGPQHKSAGAKPKARGALRSKISKTSGGRGGARRRGLAKPQGTLRSSATPLR